MTNEQLKILLHSQAELLEHAIEKSVELMPECADRELEWWEGEHRTSGTWLQRDGQEQRPTGRHIALIPLYDHLEMLRGYISALNTKPVVMDCK